MASYMMHLAAANEYIKNHNINNKEEFISGVIDVDLAKDKTKSHYSKPCNKSNIKEILLNKVSLKGYLSEHNLDSDYNKGTFFHLITDYEFYNNFLDSQQFDDLPSSIFKDKIYHDYEVLNKEIKNKYNVIVPEIVKKFDIENKDNFCYIIDKTKINGFIDKMGTIDLDSYK